MPIKLIIVIIFTIIAVIFAAQNSLMVTVKLFKLQFESVPLYAVILLCTLFGCLIMAIIQIPSQIKLKLELSRKNAEIKKLKGIIVIPDDEKENHI
ncbi:MAG TPA: LapA family protein [Firmicutes bacterium]|nr:LapA family protein [Bacillota bacterium]